MTNPVRQPVWLSTPPRATPLARSVLTVTSCAIVVLGILDALTTYVGLELGVSRETNPLARELFAVVGFFPALVLRAAIGALVVLGLWWVAYRVARLPAVAIGVGLCTVAWWTFVVASNVQVLATRV